MRIGHLLDIHAKKVGYLHNKVVGGTAEKIWLQRFEWWNVNTINTETTGWNVMTCHDKQTSSILKDISNCQNILEFARYVLVFVGPNICPGAWGSYFIYEWTHKLYSTFFEIFLVQTFMIAERKGERGRKSGGNSLCGYQMPSKLSVACTKNEEKFKCTDLVFSKKVQDGKSKK